MVHTKRWNEPKPP